MRDCKTRDGIAYRIRPTQPDDVLRDQRFIMKLAPQPSKELLNQLVRTDYQREMALVAVAIEDRAESIVGIAQYGGNPAYCEFSVRVADEWQARGVGTELSQALFEHAKTHGVRRLYAVVPPRNTALSKLVGRLRMSMRQSSDIGSAAVEAWRTL
jgi:acetyltransferase